MSSRPQPGLYSRIARQVAPYRAHLALMIGLDLVLIPVALLLPLPLTIAVDALTSSGKASLIARYLPSAFVDSQQKQILVAVALMLSIGLLHHLLGLVNWLLRTYTGERIVMGFRSRLFTHVQRLSISYHDRQGSSDSTYRIQHDAPAIQSLTIQGLLPLVTAALTLIAMLVVTFSLDWQLALIGLVAAPSLTLLTRHYSRLMHRQWTEVKDDDSRAMSIVQEVLSAVRVVKAFGQEQGEHDRFIEQSTRYMNGQLKLSRLQATFYVAGGMTVAVISAAALFVGARHVLSGVLSIGELLMMTTYLAKLHEPLGTMSSKLVELQASLVSVGRAFDLLDEVPEVRERPDARPLRHARGEFVFRNVSFGYDPANPVLCDINFQIEPGARVAICGESGAGKSTLLSLITRMYDPSAGIVLLDGRNIADYKIADLRDQFTIMLQEPVLFSTTIADNIAYSRPGATRDEITDAAIAAGAHDFIMALPDQYETEVGQRGACLSGGERQRISLARAFLKDAPIVILDEPTSSVDSRTEKVIVEATERLLRGRTTFIIAHRPMTLAGCDVRLSVADKHVIAMDREQHHTALKDRIRAVRPELAWELAPISAQ